jgi:uncharacterized protein (TIGR03435 family)
VPSAGRPCACGLFIFEERHLPTHMLVPTTEPEGHGTGTGLTPPPGASPISSWLDCELCRLCAPRIFLRSVHSNAQRQIPTAEAQDDAEDHTDEAAPYRSCLWPASSRATDFMTPTKGSTQTLNLPLGNSGSAFSRTLKTLSLSARQDYPMYMQRVLFVTLLALAVAPAQVPDARPKAGDPAPVVQPAKIFQAPNAAQWNWDAMRGKVVVLALSSNMILFDNGRHWNEVAEHFEGSPVEFVVTAEDSDPNIEQVLRAHPLRGWVVDDADRKISRSLGVERPWAMGGQVVVVNPDGTIAGYTSAMNLRAGMISALMRGEPWGLGSQSVQPAPARGPVPLPDYEPSYQVHITPSAIQGAQALSQDDRWIARGLTLKALVIRAFRDDADACCKPFDMLQLMQLMRTGRDQQYRIDFPPDLDSGKLYDVILLLPKPDPAAIPGLVRKAIQDKFHLSVIHQNRPGDVYVLRAPNGKPPQLKESPPTPAGPNAGGGFSISGSELNFRLATMATLARVLQNRLRRPVIDETLLAGRYSFFSTSKDKGPQAIIDMLQNQLGLLVTSETRDLDYLVVRPDDEEDSEHSPSSPRPRPSVPSIRI